MVSKTVVIAIDNSKECLQALDFALQHFPKGYSYHLVHIQPRPFGSTFVTTTAAAGILHDSRSALEKDMVVTGATSRFMEDIFAPRVRMAGVDFFKVVLDAISDSSSHIGAALCEYAEKIEAAALIAMRRNKSHVSRFFIGSVTRYCALHSPTPFVIVASSASRHCI
ncbi:g5198 [Coccomyxa elongata]